MRLQCDICHLAAAVVIICGEADMAACAECEESMSCSHDDARRIPLEKEAEPAKSEKGISCDACKVAPATVFSGAQRQVFCHGCDSAMHAGKSMEECPRFIFLGSCLPPAESSEASDNTATDTPKAADAHADVSSAPNGEGQQQQQQQQQQQMVDILFTGTPAKADAAHDDGLGLEWLAGMDDFMAPGAAGAGGLLEVPEEMASRDSMPRNGNGMPNWASPNMLFMGGDAMGAEDEVHEDEVHEDGGMQHPDSPVSHLPELGMPARKGPGYTTGVRTQKSVARSGNVPFGQRKPSQKRGAAAAGQGVRITAGAVDGTAPKDAVAVVMDTAGSSAAAAAAAARAAAASAELSSFHTAPASYARRCVHCGANKTPQWRAGPAGQKTLCNACGVRYKAGRLQPVVAFPPPSFAMPDGPTSSGDSGGSAGHSNSDDGGVSRHQAVRFTAGLRHEGGSSSRMRKSASEPELHQNERRVRRKWGSHLAISSLA